MKYKAEENLEAANLLIGESMYSASIHCLYYSCFQLSMYALNRSGTLYEEQARQSKGCDAHHYVINAMATLIKGKSHIGFLDYNTKISKLKKLRKKADYEIGQIEKEAAERAYAMANEITRIINTSISDYEH